VAAAVAGLLATGTAAQERPDFSGHWTAAAEARPTPGGRGAPTGTMGSGWGSTITIAQDADTLTVEYVFFSRGDLQPPLEFTYPLDGTETQHTVMMGRGIQEQVSWTAWEGDTLVITTLHSFPDPDDGQPLTSEVKRKLSFEPSTRLASPPSLVVETTLSGVLGGPSSSNRTAYTKG
jgi:hypothetical protein